MTLIEEALYHNDIGKYRVARSKNIQNKRGFYGFFTHSLIRIHPLQNKGFLPVRFVPIPLSYFYILLLQLWFMPHNARKV